MIGVITGQYVHLPSRVQYLGLILPFCILDGGYEICNLVNRFLRFGNFLNPSSGLSLKVC